MDGATPSRTNGIDVASGTLVVLNENAVLKAMAYKDGIADSAVTEAEFTIRRSTDGGSGSGEWLAALLALGFALRFREVKEESRCSSAAGDGGQ